MNLRGFEMAVMFAILVSFNYFYKKIIVTIISQHFILFVYITYIVLQMTM